MDERSCREKHSDLFHTMKKIIELETKSLEIRMNGIDRATVLQTTDLKSHLEKLNGHQAELRGFQNRFLTIERYEDQQKSIKVWMDAAKDDLSKLVYDNNKRFSIQNKISMLALIVSAAAIVIATILYFIK